MSAVATRAADIVNAMAGMRRMFFNMSVSADYLLATAEVCAVALERGHLDAIVNMSQMTVSKMTLTSTCYRVRASVVALAGRTCVELVVLDPMLRRTVFLENPLFSMLEHAR